MSTPTPPTTQRPIEDLAPPDVMYWEGVEYRVVQVFWFEELEMYVIDSRYTQWNHQAVWLAFAGTTITVLA
jgi:hypothetical protein